MPTTTAEVHTTHLAVIEPPWPYLPNHPSSFNQARQIVILDVEGGLQEGALHDPAFGTTVVASQVLRVMPVETSTYSLVQSPDD